MRALLDVNVLIALLDTAHVHHARARQWLEANIAYGWASCPITENGCVRILSQPRYPRQTRLVDAADRLREAQATRWHAFWPDSISALDDERIRLEELHSHAQVTDSYLLALAVANHGRLVTFDRNVRLASVPDANADHLLTI